MEHEELTEKIIGCAMTVHRVLAEGFGVGVPECPCDGLEVGSMRIEWPLDVTYDGVIVGKFEPDMMVNGQIILEIKAVQTMATAHEVQLVNYLTATGIEVGLVLNFGASRLEFNASTAPIAQNHRRQGN